MTSSRLFHESGDLLENHTLVLHEPLGFLIFFEMEIPKVKQQKSSKRLGVES